VRVNLKLRCAGTAAADETWVDGRAALPKPLYEMGLAISRPDHSQQRA
jgi:hypothetical protein